MDSNTTNPPGINTSTTTDEGTNPLPPVWTMRFIPVGGVNYSTDLDDDHFDTVEQAAQVWAQRRNDWTGRFPCWGDGGEGADQTAVIGALYCLDDEDRWVGADVVEGYSVRELSDHIGEPAHYFDEDDDQDDEDEVEPVQPLRRINVMVRNDPPGVSTLPRHIGARPVQERQYADGLIVLVEELPSDITVAQLVATVWIWADGMNGGWHRRYVNTPSDVGALVGGFRRGLAKLGLYDRRDGGLYWPEGTRRSIHDGMNRVTPNNWLCA